MSVDFEGLFESFVAESSEMLDRAEGSVLELEKGFNKEVVNDIFRAFHTIKGDSGIFGLQEITDTAHALENMLDLMRAEKLEVSMERIDLLLTGIDRLRQMIAAARVGPGGVQLSSDGDVKTLLDTLHKAIAGDRQVPVKKPQTIVRQNSVGEGGSFSLRVPKRYRLDAEARGHYLSLVYVDLYAQGISSLLEIRQILDNLEDQGSLLMQGVLENMLPGRGPGADGSLLPYYMVLATQGPVEPFLEHHGIGGKVLRVLHTPKGQNAVPVGGAAVPVDLVEDDAGVSGEAGTGGATPAVPAPLLAGENAIRDDRNAEEGVLLDEGRGTAGMIVKMPAKKTKQSAVEAPPSAMPPAEPKE
ncbi:MAG TPA: Hpt domain-containing protein, partial [Spirochaetota bacterium]|nr:Hpt domain-containing protein [Spirochaetota bacterium]